MHVVIISLFSLSLFSSHFVIIKLRSALFARIVVFLLLLAAAVAIVVCYFLYISAHRANKSLSCLRRLLSIFCTKATTSKFICVMKSTFVLKWNMNLGRSSAYAEVDIHSHVYTGKIEREMWKKIVFYECVSLFSYYFATRLLQMHSKFVCIHTENER